MSEHKVYLSSGSPDSSWFTRLRESNLTKAGVGIGVAAAITLGVKEVTEEDFHLQERIERVEDGVEAIASDIDLADVGDTVIEGLESSAPWALAAGGALTLSMALSRRGVNRTKTQLAVHGYQERKSTFSERYKSGLMLPVIGATALSTSLLINSEVASGPNRMVESLASLADDQDGEPYLLLEDGSNHFMNKSELDSSLSREEFAATALTLSEEDGVATLPFDVELTDIEHSGGSQTSLLMASPNFEGVPQINPKVESNATCKLINERCLLEDNEIVVDSGEAIEVGDSIIIRGEEFEVAGLAEEPQSLLNRFVAYVNTDGMENIRGDEESAFHGLLVNTSDPQKAKESLEQLQVTNETELLPMAQVLENNEDFWEGNVSALMMILILSTTGFAGGAMYKSKIVERERAKKEEATVRSMGFGKKDLLQVDLANSFINSAKTIVPVYPASLAIQHIANGSIPGFNSEATLGMSIAAAGTIFAAKSAGSLVMFSKKDKNLAEDI